jgi:hypothetical protein
MRIAAGKLALLPEWEVKCMLGRHLWQDAIHADELLKRMTDLRWPRKAPLHPGEVISDFMALLDEAPDTVAFLITVYQVIKPRLVAAYTAHAGTTAPLADEPTHLLLERAIQEEQQHIREGEAMIQALAVVYDVEPTLAWRRRVEEAYARTGGFDTPGTTSEREVSTHFANHTIHSAPPVAARDSRFRFAIGGFDTPDGAADTFDQFIAHRDADNEMHAAELLGRNIYEHPEMPWEYHVDMARQCWDEVRHAVLYQKYLEELGGHLGGYPVVPGNYAYRIALDFAHRLYDLHLRGEKLGMPDLIRFRDEATQTGNHTYALLNDYIHADEVPHVKNGRWLEWLLNNDKAAFRKVERETMELRAAYEQNNTGDPLLQRYQGLAAIIPPERQPD